MKIALVGIGKIALDQHVPALAASPDFQLAATVSRHGTVAGVAAYTDIAVMLLDNPDIAIVSLCLPPRPRFEPARAALEAGRHVMLEKPPGATLSECFELRALAREKNVALYATWHSREAAAVITARDWLAGRQITSAHIRWRESVRKWHPGQDWVFDPGGMGVFDPGINALSILTEILPFKIHLTSAELETPINRQTPIAARLAFSRNISAEFDWREESGEVWSIEVQTDAGRLELLNGGARMRIDGIETPPLAEGPTGEYPRLYAAMARFADERHIEMDLSPMRHVSDAFTLGAHITADAFEW